MQEDPRDDTDSYHGAKRNEFSPATFLQTLHSATKSIGFLTSTDEICSAAVRHACSLPDTNAALLLLFAEDRSCMCVQASAPTARDQFPLLRNANVDFHCLVAARRALRLADVAPGAEPIACEAYSEYSFAPLEVGGAVLGLLGVARSAQGFSPFELELFCGLASVTATALEQARFRELAVAEGRRRLRLERYFSPQVVAHLLSEDDALEDGLRCEATVLFSDIRGFTAFSDSRDPAEVLEILNLYFELVTRLVFEHGGMIDKLIGDGMLAIFGTPRPNPDHAIAAARCAAALQAEVGKLDVTRFGLPGLQIGVGLHSGPVLLGDLGGESFMDFTVLGSTVNLASRIESLTKSLDAPVLLSEAVLCGLGGRAQTEDLGDVDIRGISQAVRLHRLLAVDRQAPVDQCPRGPSISPPD